MKKHATFILTLLVLLMTVSCATSKEAAVQVETAITPAIVTPYVEETVPKDHPVIEQNSTPEQNPIPEQNSTPEQNPIPEQNSTPEQNPIPEQNPVPAVEEVPVSHGDEEVVFITDAYFEVPEPEPEAELSQENEEQVIDSIAVTEIILHEETQEPVPQTQVVEEESSFDTAVVVQVEEVRIPQIVSEPRLEQADIVEEEEKSSPTAMHKAAVTIVILVIVFIILFFCYYFAVWKRRNRY